MNRTPMKRTAMKRGTPPPPRPAKQIDYTPRPRAAAVAVADGKARMVVPVPKAAPVECEAYRRMVAARPCINCGLEKRSQAAHPNTGKAKGMKADDRLCFPLCHVGGNSCHPRFDLYQLYGRLKQSELEPEWTLQTQRGILSDGDWPLGLPLPEGLIDHERI